MSVEHLDAVLAIEHISFSRPWTARHFLDEIESRFAGPLVAVGLRGEVVGYLCPQVVVDAGEILDVAVDPAARGKGVGRLLVATALAWCRRQGAEHVGLEVRVGNVEAIRLYQSFGFAEVGRRKRYYDDGEDAVVMEYTFTGNEEYDAV
jgi:[ribosomal protein S18]-alanine N-acetyltransferase